MTAAPIWSSYSAAFPQPSVIKELVHSIRHSMLDSNHLQAPLSEVEAARLFACRLVPFTDPAARQSDHRASLVPRKENGWQFDIVFNAYDPRHRRRFSVAHEIGHVFFYDRRSSPPRRLASQASRGEENFCDAFAAELLVPEPSLDEVHDVGDMVAVAARMMVSVQVVAMQMLRHDRLPWRAVFEVAKVGKPTEPSHVVPRIVWSVARSGTFVPSWVRYRQGPALEALTSGAACSGSAQIVAGNLTGVADQWAVPISDGRVLVAVGRK